MKKGGGGGGRLPSDKDADKCFLKATGSSGVEISVDDFLNPCIFLMREAFFKFTFLLNGVLLSLQKEDVSFFPQYYLHAAPDIGAQCF